jgi:hypothetical protein
MENEKWRMENAKWEIELLKFLAVPDLWHRGERVECRKRVPDWTDGRCKTEPSFFEIRLLPPGFLASISACTKLYHSPFSILHFTLGDRQGSPYPRPPVARRGGACSWVRIPRAGRQSSLRQSFLPRFL